MLSEKKIKTIFFFTKNVKVRMTFVECVLKTLNKERNLSLQMYTQDICSRLNCKVHVWNENEINGNKFGIAP